MSDLDDIRDRLKRAPEPEYKPGEAVSDVAAKRTVAEIAERLKLNPDFVNSLFEELAEASGKRLEGAVSAVFDAVAPFLSGDAVKAPQVNYYAVRLPDSTRATFPGDRLTTIAKSSCGWPDTVKVVLPSTTDTEGVYVLTSPTRQSAILKPDNDEDVWMIPLFDSVKAIESQADYKWSSGDDTFELTIYGEGDDRKMVVTVPMGALSENERNEVDAAIKGDLELISVPWFAPGVTTSQPHKKITWTWANPDERDNIVVTSADVGKVGLVRRDGTYWLCTGTEEGAWSGPVENPDNGCASCWNSTTDDPAGCMHCGRDIPLLRAFPTRGPVSSPMKFDNFEQLKAWWGDTRTPGSHEIVLPTWGMIGDVEVHAGDVLQVTPGGSVMVNGSNLMTTEEFWHEVEVEKNDKVAVIDELKAGIVRAFGEEDKREEIVFVESHERTEVTFQPIGKRDDDDDAG